jgi:hypothetical protein
MSLSLNGGFVGGWCRNFVGSESGQKQSFKHLQNMVYNTTQHPPTPHPPATQFLYTVYCTFTFGEGQEGEGWGRLERRERGNSSQEGSKISTRLTVSPVY